MLNELGIDQGGPIETLAGRAARQVDVTGRLLSLLTSGFEPPQSLLEEAGGLGIDIQAVYNMVSELYEEAEDD